jgi:MerR family redox-sensitive transcriptional activator SoxR
MPDLTISQVAKQFGLRASALRYYEQLGILPPVHRVSGQRRYDPASVRRVAVIQHARQSGFSLDEIQQLFSGFQPGTRASRRWQELSKRKLAELDASMERIKSMQSLLRRIGDCRCNALDDCGAALLRHGCADHERAG